MRLHLQIISRVTALACAILLGATGTPMLAPCEVQRLTTDDTTQWGLTFGISVAVGGDRVVVGAKYADSIFSVNSGSAYVYRREGAHRVQEARLAPSDGTDTDLFARSVAISGDYVVASPMGAEAAYVFRRDETGWVEDAKLVAWDADAHTVWLLNLDCATPGRPEKTEYVLDTTAEGRYAYIGSNCGAEVRGDRIMSLRRIIIMLNAVTAGQGAMS